MSYKPSASAVLKLSAVSLERGSQSRGERGEGEGGGEGEREERRREVGCFAGCNGYHNRISSMSEVSINFCAFNISVCRVQRCYLQD